MDFQPDSPPLAMETELATTSEDSGKVEGSQESIEDKKDEHVPSTSSQSSQKPLPDYSAAKTGNIHKPLYNTGHNNSFGYIMV